jgi:YVTN family beta-propeller protein
MRSNSFARSICWIGNLKPYRATAHFKLTIVFTLLLALSFSQAYAQQESGNQAFAPQRYTREGIAVEFSVDAVAPQRAKAHELLAGTEATVRFKITDASTGKALSNLRPTAWIDQRESDTATDARGCREKIQSFLQASFNNRADIDLNTYFVLALNNEPNISVIDPLSGFGNSKLYTLIPLSSPGEDWLLSGDRKRLYVSMPLANQVAVIETATWTVLRNIDAGARPARLALQHDEKYLWVGNDSGTESGVTVIDTETLKTAAHISTGAGPHDIALTDDDRYAFITNKQDGTLSVIDVRRLARVKDLKTGSLPAALAFSSLGKAVYVVHEGDGAIVAVDALKHEVLARMKAQPGLRAIRFTPDGRFGFAVNRASASVDIFDVSTNQIIKSVAVGPTPDQLTFTKDFAYVRSSGSEFVNMITLAGLSKEAHEVSINRFPAGQRAPQDAAFTSLADAIIPAPEGGSVLVANAADKMIYYYTEGMAAPMGSFQNYRRNPRALLVLDNSLRETSPGVYTTIVRLTGQGRYDVAFLLDSPRLVNCFDLTIKENPDLPRPKEVAIRVEPMLREGAILAGENYQLRFRVTDASTHQAKELKDMGVLVFLAPGIWQQRQWAKPLGDGLYEVSFVPPHAGVYYVFFQCPSLGVQFNQLPSFTLQVTKDRAASVETKESKP